MKKSAKKTMGMFSCIVVGVMYGVGLTLCLSLLFALMINYEKITWDSVGYGIMLIFYISVLCSTSISLHKIKRKRTLACFALALIYHLLLVALTMAFFGGRYYDVIPAMLPIAIGAGTSRVLFFLKEERKSYRHAKIRFN